MIITEVIMILMLLTLGTIASVMDIRTGIIPNKLVFRFGIGAALTDIVYYGVFVQDLLGLFLLNILFVIVIDLILYHTHAFAGGDTKLLIVLAMIYPAGMYTVFEKTKITLFAVIAFAILEGYLFMLGMSAYKYLTGKTKTSIKNIVKYVKEYVIRYLIASIYIVLVILLYEVLSARFVWIHAIPIAIPCLAIAWISAQKDVFRKKSIIAVALLFDIGISVYLKIIPISLNPASYIYTAVLLLCQMSIRTVIYETIPLINVKKGTILSLISSMMMQNSRIKDIPVLSTEDLQSRLTECEAEAVKKWGELHKDVKEIIIVRKIPFACFVTMGYITYFILWGLAG